MTGFQTELPGPQMNATLLSQVYECAPYLARRDDTIQWRKITAKKHPDCDECWQRQHETGGRCGVRLPAMVTRQIKDSPKSVLKLCRQHQDLWEQRDETAKRGRR